MFLQIKSLWKLKMTKGKTFLHSTLWFERYAHEFEEINENPFLVTHEFIMVIFQAMGFVLNLLLFHGTTFLVNISEEKGTFGNLPGLDE